MTAADAGWVLLAALAATYGTLIGAGGGFLAVPALLILMPGLSPLQVTSASLLLVLANSASGSVAYLRQRRVDIGLALRLAPATVPGAVLGVYLVAWVPRRPFEVLVGILMLAIAGTLFWQPAAARRRGPARSGGRQLTDGQGNVYHYHVPMLPALAISFGVGVLSSFLGVGGGIIHVPALVRLFLMPVHVATATSHLILVVTSLAGVITHLFGGGYQGTGRLGLELAVGGVLGGQMGARLSLRVGSAAVVRSLAVGLVLVGLRLLMKAAG